MRTVVALVLIALGVALRLNPYHEFNFVPIGALALFAGSCLPLRWAWVVPLAVMGLSDLYLDWGSGRAVLDASRVFSYAALAVIPVLGLLVRRSRAGLYLVPGLAVAGSAIFFALSNLGSWIDLPMLYTRDLAGLADAYVKAIPFYRNTFLSDLIGAPLFFAAGYLIERAYRRLTASQAVSAEAGKSSIA
ncbi:hypothetical protein OJF2_24710 [Aquisphaera giovannonii]|uniref:Rod shape-determining protein MreD n=1 Tax=Aquisphaera giovannonii TaxID=406548 RepID=A0A5B9W0Z8_9BACT|nr:DUF6580 family putative transport protein [Aquisphaera giovannonii]QEH33939.1 hypothetical protein OJF2_24710 [Aquisphaera giovannonii]